MRTIGPWFFPETPDDCKRWESSVIYRGLSLGVLCVANTRIEGAWSAYCGRVPGMDYDVEFRMVLDHGDKLPETVARAIFPEFMDVPYAP